MGTDHWIIDPKEMPSDKWTELCNRIRTIIDDYVSEIKLVQIKVFVDDHTTMFLKIGEDHAIYEYWSKIKKEYVTIGGKVYE
jgi:hypothetical protein